MFPEILVMLSLDERDESVLEAVRLHARALGCIKLVVAHVFNEDPLTGPLAGLMEMPEHSAPPEVLVAVEQLAQQLPGILVVGEHATGSPETEIDRICEEHEVDLIVLGRNAADGDKPGWGASGSKLLRLAPCSVLVVPQGCKVSLDDIVAGLDFSNHGINALSHACQLSDKVRAVYHFHIPRSRVGGLTQEQWHTKVLGSASELLQREVLPLLPQGAAPELVVVGQGKVGEALIGEAGPRLLVVGSRGITHMAFTLLGSSANRVSARALGPVLVVRDKEVPAQGLLERLVRR